MFLGVFLATHAGIFFVNLMFRRGYFDISIDKDKDKKLQTRASHA
jgi:hypothetical protein